jgi:hypothetical protein
VQPLSSAVFVKASRFQLYVNALGAVLPANDEEEQFIDTVKGFVVARCISNIRTEIRWRLKTAWRELRISKKRTCIRALLTLTAAWRSN